jgi:hypothetical protein
VLAFLAQQLLAEALACGDEQLLLPQLSGLLQLLQAAAACAAVPGADSAINNGTQALVDTMSAVLQVHRQGALLRLFVRSIYIPFCLHLHMAVAKTSGPARCLAPCLQACRYATCGTSYLCCASRT